MKVLFFSTGLGVGGAEKQVIDLASEFIKKGHIVKVVALTGSCHYSVSDALNDCLVFLEAEKKPLSLAQTLFRLIRLIENFQPDVIHSHMVHANIFARVARLFCRVPLLVSTVHSQNEGGKFRMLAYRLTDALADITTNVSEGAAESFIQQKAAPAERIQVVYNGIDTSFFTPDTFKREALREQYKLNHNFTILAVGRLTEAKDYPNLLHAFHMIRKRGIDARLLIAGHGHLKGPLSNLVDQLGMESAVEFLGVRHDIDHLMNTADCFVLSSEWEGLPLVIGEAMATGLPVVVTDAGGAREFVGTAGYVVPIKSAEELADGIIKVNDMSLNERAELGKKARERIVKHYSLSAVADTWIELYHKMKV